MKSKSLNELILVSILLSIMTLNAFSNNGIADRYPGGSDAIRIFIQENVLFPKKAHKNNIVGTSVSLIQVQQNGKIDISIVNSLGAEIDDEVLRVLSISENNWLPIKDSSHIDSFYVQIVFTDSFNPSFHREKVKMDNLLGEVFVVGYNEIQSDESIINKLNILLKEKNYESAIIQLDELIRRNPFHKQFYQLRISCKKKLNYNSDEISADLNVITSFLNILDYQID